MAIGRNEEIAPITIHIIKRLFLVTFNESKAPTRLEIMIPQEKTMLIVIAELLISGTRSMLSLILKIIKYHENALNIRKNFVQESPRFHRFREFFSSILGNLNYLSNNNSCESSVDVFNKT